MIGTAIDAWRLYRGVTVLRASATAFRAAPNLQTTWNLAGSVVGVIGPDKVINAMIRYAERLALGAAERDAAAADEMVSLMEARAPRLTGTLAGGITKAQAEGGWTITATARKGAGVDYARIVEFGSPAGERGRRVASDAYFAGASSGRGAKPRGHPGTPAQPYFVPSIHEALEGRAQALASLSDTAAQSEDLT